MLELRGGPAERVGPLFDPTRRLRPRGRAVAAFAASVLIAGLTGCATPSATGPATGGPPPPVSAEPPPDLLAQARSAYEAGDYDVAARGADSLYYMWRADEDRSAYADSALWIEARALADAGSVAASAERLAELLERDVDEDMRAQATRARAALLASLAREPESVGLLVANPDAVEDEGWDVLRSAAARMSAEELSRIPGAVEPANAVEASVAARLAAALAASDVAEEARRVARAVTVAGGEDADLQLAEAVLDGSIGPSLEPVRIGAILPLTGRFAAVGRFLQNGMRLALNEAAGRSITVELLVLDDGSEPARAAALLAELETEGVAAVIGPIRSQAFDEAVAVRRDPGLLLVSPTATEMLGPRPNAYTLWDLQRRTADVAFEAGRWLAAELGVVQLGALITDSPVGRDALLAFRAGAARSGGVVSGYASYSPDSTTFEAPIQVVGAYAPQAVFISTRDASAVLQIGPQLSFYGLRDIVLVGGPSWAEPAVVRRLDPSFADYKLVGTFVDQFSENGGWTDFKRSYEIAYRASLRDNMLPALGHDAMLLVIAALPERGPAHPGAVSRTFAALERVSGASGDLRPDPATSTVSRTPKIRMILDRSLVDPDPEAIRAGLAEARAIEAARTRRRQADAVEAVAELDRGNGG